MTQDRRRTSSAPGRADDAAIDPADCALVIISCDKPRNLWGPSLSLHRCYWPDCPYPTFLVSDTVPLEDPRVRSSVVGTALSWSEMARIALLSLLHLEVLFKVKDFFLTRPASSAAIGAQHRSLHALGGVYLGLVPLPRPNCRLPGHPGIGEHERGSPFRASPQAAL